MIFGILFSILALIAAIWVIVDVAGKKRMEDGEKIIWIVFAIIFSIITAIVYYFVKKR